MKYINYYLSLIFSLILSFVIISVIILLATLFIKTRFELFVINKENIAINDNLILLESLNNSVVYLKFNVNDIEIIDNRYMITNHSKNKQYNAMSLNITKSTSYKHPIINTNDYVKGSGSLEFNNSNILLQLIPISTINQKFSVCFFIKLSNVTGNKVIVCQANSNPTMGWIIRVDGNNLKVIIGTNQDNNWKEIIVVPNFINQINIDWSHVVLTYDITQNPKWNIYIDGFKFTDNLNTQNINMNLIDVNTKRFLFMNCQSNTNCKQINNVSVGLDLQSLFIGFEFNKPLFSLVDNNTLASLVENNQDFYNLGFSGTRNTNYIIKYIPISDSFHVSFISTNTQTITIPVNCIVDILVVGGGGGGGTRHGGGGGAGGLIYVQNYTLVSGSYFITVGNGGGSGANGQNSSIKFNNNDIFNAIGGGAGGSWDTGAGRTGGSGGGGGFGGAIGTTNQGNNGGTVSGSSTYKHGGGGGAGSAGISGTFTKCGNGGIGRQINITGLDVWYAGGGGGGSHNSDNGSFPTNSSMRSEGGLGGGGAGGVPTQISNGVNGQPNTGGGGGGASVPWGSGSVGGNGGSGVVIIKFRISDFKVANQPVYNMTDQTNIGFTNFLPEGTLMDDFRLYDFALNENEIKTLYYGNTLASISSSAKGKEDNECVNNSILESKNLISIPANNAKLTFISSITVNTITNHPQYKQIFTYSDNPNSEYVLLFSQPLFHENSVRNPYSPIKLFNKSINDLFPNDEINFTAFLSLNALEKTVNNDKFLYNYDVDGKYALDFKVHDCGNIIFKEPTRPSGDYIYIKTPTSFVISRYSIKAVTGFINRAPTSWTLFVYNSKVNNYMSYSFPPVGEKITEKNYCAINQRTLIVDLNYTNSSQKISSNEFLFVFHSTIGNSDTDKFGILSFDELNLFSENNSSIV
jgi:hypothetical protein